MTRAALVAGLKAAGLEPSDTIPRTPSLGSTWVEWVRTEYRTTAGGCVAAGSSWHVLHILPSTDPTDLDKLRDAVPAALGAAGVVTESADPVSLVLEAAPTNPVAGIRWTVRTP